MYRAKMPPKDLWKQIFHTCLAQAWLLELLSLLGCLHGSQIREDDNVHSSSRIRPIDVDTATAEKIGREALEKVGYDEIINLSVKAGFVEFKVKFDVQLTSYESAAATGFARVFSRYALAAAVTAQADSPLPGPADVAAVGIIVLGLLDAGLLDGYLLSSVGDLFTSSAATLADTATTRVRDYGRNCRDQLKKCMEESPSRGRPGSGSHPGQSICADCFDQCNSQQGVWPTRTFAKKDCQWWDGR